MVATGRNARRWGAYAALGVAVALLALWAVREPESAPQSPSETKCQYTYQPSKQGKVVIQLRTGSSCHQTPGESHEDDAYKAARQANVATIIAAVRHYLHRMIMDPVSLLTLVLAASTVALWLVTRRLWKGAEAGSDDIKESIKQATRSAAAMEDVAKAMTTNAAHVAQTVQTNQEIAEAQRVFGQMQLRPYVSVLLNTARYQETAKNMPFAVCPVLVNTGPTPARKVTYRAKSAILDFPIDLSYRFTLPKPSKGRNLIAPQQKVTIDAVVEGLIPDDEIDDVKFIKGKVLVGWGVVSYYDAFGRRYRTTFCHQMNWGMAPNPETGVVEERVFGIYVGKHNNAN